MTEDNNTPVEPTGYRCQTITDDGSTKRVILQHTEQKDQRMTITAPSGTDTLPEVYGDFKVGKVYDADFNVIEN